MARCGLSLSFWITLMNAFFYTTSVLAEGFVEEVSCRSDHLTVMLNKTDPDLQRWIADTGSRPVAYVYEHKDHGPCYTELKRGRNRVNFNLTIPYSEGCGVYLSHLEPNYLSSETTIAIEDIANIDGSKPIRINHVFCLYTQEVQALKINDVSQGHQIVASTGGKPKPKVNLVIRDRTGRNVKTAKFGDGLEFLLMLSPDQAYKAISPRHCMFSNKNDMTMPDARTLTFVQSNCPVAGLNEIVEPLQDIRDDIYYTKFNAFRFGNQSKVYAHCKVAVCLDSHECEKPCYKHSLNTTKFITENRHLLRRAKRSGTAQSKSSAKDGDEGEIDVSNSFSVLNEVEELPLIDKDDEFVQSASYPHIPSSNSYTALLLVTGILSMWFVVSVVTIVCLVRRVRRHRTTTPSEMDRMSFYKTSSRMASSDVWALDSRPCRGYSPPPLSIATSMDSCNLPGSGNPQWSQHSIPRILQ